MSVRKSYWLTRMKLDNMAEHFRFKVSPCWWGSGAEQALRTRDDWLLHTASGGNRP